MTAALCTSLLAAGGCDEKKADAAQPDKPAAAANEAPAEKEAAAKPEPVKEGVAVHCDEIAEFGYCTETPYASPTWDALGEELLEGRCKRGKFGKGECPSEGRLGACTASNGEVVQYASGGGSKRSAQDAQTHCKDMFAGTWART